MAIKISTYSGTTGALTGNVTLNIKVPGTFGGTDPQASGFQGRRLIQIGLWLEARAPSDRVTTLAIQDLDSVLPAPLTGQTIGNLIDQTVGAGARALTLPPGNLPFQLSFPVDPTLPGYIKAIIPSGLYLVVTFTKNVIGVDTATVNVAWDDFS